MRMESVRITLRPNKLFSTTITKSRSFKLEAPYLFIGHNPDINTGHLQELIKV